MKQFYVFKELVIGGLSKEELLLSLSKNNIHFNKYAYTLFEHNNFIPSDKKENVTLVKAKLDELGLEKSCTQEELSSQISKIGLEKCPLYLAAFLRLEYMDQYEYL